MKKMAHYISAFIRSQEIERLNTKPILTENDQNHLHYLLSEEAASLRHGNGLLRHEVQRLHELLANNLH